MLDPALETLFLPLRDGFISMPDRVLFLRAREGAALRAWPQSLFVCEQTFKPSADALVRAGFRVDNAVTDERFQLVLVLPPRQREESRALLAHAVSRLSPDGCIVASAANDEGAKSHESDLRELVGDVRTLSKHKCRVFWSRPERVDENVLREWLKLDAPRPIADGRFVSRPGVFAWDRIDFASQLLAQCLPATLMGRAADLGAGFGYLSFELLKQRPNITALDAYEAELRALDLARVNLASFSDSKTLQFHWHDVTMGLHALYDVIVSNPPFHAQGSVDRPDIGQRFIVVAAQSLKPSGELYLVANRHLPYEAILSAHFATTRVLAQERGFKVIAAVKVSK